MRWLVLFSLLLAQSALAQTVLPTRTLRAGTAITVHDLALTTDPTPLGAAATLDEVLGQEAVVTLYAGRAIPLASLGPPALIERNQLVTLLVMRGGLEVRVDGRALARGAEGQDVRVMNLSSRNTVTGVVAAPGLVIIP